MSTFAVIDFETTGLSPGQGARPTEVAVVMIDNGRIVARYQSLMNANVPIPYEIQLKTGITNEMVRKAPSVASVMKAAFGFVGKHPLVAHNAAFDCKFWDIELQSLRQRRQQEFICSLKLSRRLFSDAPNHRLETLVQMLRLPATGKYHRALADAEATAYLLIRIQQEITRRFRLPVVSHGLLLAVQETSPSQLKSCIENYREAK
jgi:DNA polymerase-3 subunit epsilon